jgi:predicted alpha/beta superfamily hydrolase
MRISGSLLCATVLVIFVATSSAAASSQGATPEPQTTSRPAAASPLHRVQFTSAFTGEAYDVQVYVPTTPAPATGFPVIYVLDGDALFGTFMEAVRTRANAGELEHAVVVGIAGAKGPKGADRFYDFSSSDFSSEEKTFVVDADVNAKHAGSELFFQTIEREIKPRVATLAKVDPSRASLFGWSLGGQFVLHTLFRHPASFQTFEALSPSIWWDDSVILKDVPELFVALPHLKTPPRVFIGAGGREQEVPPIFDNKSEQDKLRLEVQHARMVDNARDLSRDLEARDRAHRLVLRSKIFEGQTHNSVPWAALNEVLDFAIGRGESAPKS